MVVCPVAVSPGVALPGVALPGVAPQAAAPQEGVRPEADPAVAPLEAVVSPVVVPPVGVPAAGVVFPAVALLVAVFPAEAALPEVARQAVLLAAVVRPDPAYRAVVSPVDQVTVAARKPVVGTVRVRLVPAVKVRAKAMVTATADRLAVMDKVKVPVPARKAMGNRGLEVMVARPAPVRDRTAAVARVPAEPVVMLKAAPAAREYRLAVREPVAEQEPAEAALVVVRKGNPVSPSGPVMVAAMWTAVVALWS